MLTSNAALAEDLFQETWIRVLERGHQYDGKFKFEAWLFTIARNLVIDWQRQKKAVSLAGRKATLTITWSSKASPRVQYATWIASRAAMLTLTQAGTLNSGSRRPIPPDSTRASMNHHFSRRR